MNDEFKPSTGMKKIGEHLNIGHEVIEKILERQNTLQDQGIRKFSGRKYKT